MSDATSDSASDTPAPPRPPVGRSQRQILEKAHTGLTDRYTDITDARFVPTVTGRELGTGGELLKLTFDDGEIWWLTAVKGGE